MPPSNPVIVVPGITASYLRDLYPLPPETIWAVIGKDYERARLHPDDLRFEAREPAAVRPDQLFEIAYEELVEELRFNLADREDEPVPVYPFGYDWRQPLERIEQSLAAFVDEVIDRTKLMRHYAKAGYGDAPKVNLVGHSMGGLVIAGYVERFGGARIDKVATLASPWRGSFEAMVKVTTGTANIGGSVPSSREREAARVTPALYHLMPAFDTGIEAADRLPRSTFDIGLWQPSIIDTVASYIDRHAVERPRRKSDLRKAAEELFAGMLATALKHRERLEKLRLGDKGLADDRWLCVVGVDAVTRVRMEVKLQGRKPFFHLSSEDRMNGWDDGETVGARRQTGDGTVHFLGAVPAFLPYESLVCVTPDDYGYWELVDRAATKIGGFHGILPNMNMLHRLIVRHFTGRGDPKENTWGRRAPGVSKENWKPPLRPPRDRTDD
jgi:pimeloyl-ACP methyl ester carboxylesterase